MNKGNRLTVVLFCAFLAGLLVWHVALPDRARSETENRTLAQFPVFSWENLKDGSFTEGMEDYFADQFPLRDAWTGLKARCEQVLGKREFNGVYLCGDDTLIARVDDPGAALVERNLAAVETFAENAPGTVLLGLIPSAAEVWADRLPAGAPGFDQKDFLEKAAETGIPTVDLLGALTEHADESVYYRTDHHWTTRGAFYGANALLNTLDREPLREDGFTPETASTDFNGTLYSTSGIHWLAPDTMEYWVDEDGMKVTTWKSSAAEAGMLYDRSYLEKKDKYSSFLGGNQPLCVIENPAVNNGGKILLIRDSYADSLAPFLAQRFSEVHLMDLRYYHGSAAEYMEENGIDTAVVLYSVANFISDQNLTYLKRTAQR